jgi:hypothetical protein
MVKARSGVRAPVEGYVRVSESIDAEVHQDVEAEAKRRFRAKGWSVLEDGAEVFAQETKWQIVYLWAIPPNREVG